MEQLSLFGYDILRVAHHDEELSPTATPLKEAVKKRIRYKIPTYKKTYKFCHINPITNEIQYNGDERHIFRIRALQNIYSEIYKYTGLHLVEVRESIKMCNLTVWLEDEQAEVIGTESLSIKERVKIHIALLRLLRQGKPLESAVNTVVSRFQDKLQYIKGADYGEK